MFQSAPRVLLRGDATLYAITTVPSVFQSAPRVLLRGDEGKAAWKLSYAVSIRAPRSSAGRPLPENFEP